MRAHLYEFRSHSRQLKCSCGWERTLKTEDIRKAAARFEAHRAEAAASGA